MPRARKKGRSSSDAYTPSASARRPSITVKPRKQRERRAPLAFSPKIHTVTRHPRKTLKHLSPDVDDSGDATCVHVPTRPEHKRLENKIKSQAHRLRYPLAFVEAYEADGWNKTSRDKLKPSKELEVEHHKIVKGQRALIEGLRALLSLYATEPQVPPMAVFEDVHCSRCRSTDIAQDNDILLCDSPGCHRAYHQQCQTPVLLTNQIPEGDNLWFCEVCLAIFECLKSINSVFGTTYESVDDLFPELSRTEQQHLRVDSHSAQCQDESAMVIGGEDDDEEDDEDFVCLKGEEGDEDDEEEEEEETASERAVGDEEEMAEEVPESTQDLLYLSKDDVIDLNHRSSRSKSTNRVQEPSCKNVIVLGEPAAKINCTTGTLIFGIVAELEPPAEGKYSRWRIDYRDGTSDLLTRSKAQAAINRATVECRGDKEAAIPVVRSKRKRSEVDYRQLNELMFAGKEEDSEDDETFVVKDGSEGEPDEEEDNNEHDAEAIEQKRAMDAARCVVPSISLPTRMTAAISQQTYEKRSQRPCQRVDYHSMQKGLLS